MANWPAVTTGKVNDRVSTQIPDPSLVLREQSIQGEGVRFKAMKECYPLPPLGAIERSKERMYAVPWQEAISHHIAGEHTHTRSYCTT